MATLARIQNIPAYVTELRSRMGLYLGWVPNEFADQVSADNAYDILKGDLAVNHALHLHACMSSGEKFRIECENEKIQNILTKCLNRIQDFTHARKSLIENGILFGLGIQRKYYSTIRIKEYPGMDWIAIQEIKEVDTRRVRLERDVNDKSKVYWTIWCPIIDQYIIIEDRSENFLAPPGAGIQDYVWYMHEAEELNPYFRGLGSVIYQIAYIKSKIIQYWADLCETWSKPWVIMAIDKAKASIDASLGPSIQTTSQRITSLLETLEGMRARHALIIDREDRLQPMEMGNIGSNILREFMEYADSKIQLLLLGAELTTGTGSGVGSYALGNVHRQQTETLIMYSRTRLQEVLIRDIIFDLLYRNRMNLYELGLPALEPGDVKLELYVEAEQEKKRAIEKQIAHYKGDAEKIL